MINLQLHIYFIYNVLVTLCLFILEAFLNAHPPLYLLKWFSPPAPSPAAERNFSQTASGGGDDRLAQMLGSKKRKEKKLRQEKEAKGRQYVTQFFHRKGGSVSGSCDGKSGTLACCLFLTLSIVYKLAHFSPHISSYF